MVVVIDPDREVAEMLVAILRGEGHDACICPAYRATVERIAELHADSIILDLHYACPQATLGLVRQLRHHDTTAHLPLVVTSTSGHLLAQHAAQLDNLGCATLGKPFMLEDLFDQLECAGLNNAYTRPI